MKKETNPQKFLLLEHRPLPRHHHQNVAKTGKFCWHLCCCLYPLDCFMLRTWAGWGWRKVTSKYCVQTRPVNCSTVQYSTVQNSTGQEAACLCAGCHDKSRAMLPWPECHGSCSTVGTRGTLDITWAQNARIPSVGTGLWWPPGKFGGPC